MVLTRAELLAAVGGLRAYRRALADGSWKRVLRGAYVTGDTEITLAVKAQALGRLLPEHAVVSDRCLLWLLGVDVLPAGEVLPECVVPRLAVVPRRTGVLAREAALPAADVGALAGSGLSALRPARAVVDLMRRLDLLEAVVVVDAVLRERLCTPAELDHELAAHAGLRGVVQARRTLTLADPRAESPPESRLRVLLVLAGLPPVPQHEVRTGAGWFRLDLAYPDLRIAIEYDGREVHDKADAFASDRRRQNALVAEGWIVLRFTAADLRKNRQPAVVETVRAAVLAQTKRTA
jgi:very-short-patch-repair endonuclease